MREAELGRFEHVSPQYTVDLRKLFENTRHIVRVVKTSWRLEDVFEMFASARNSYVENILISPKAR